MCQPLPCILTLRRVSGFWFSMCGRYWTRFAIRLNIEFKAQGCDRSRCIFRQRLLACYSQIITSRYFDRLFSCMFPRRTLMIWRCSSLFWRPQLVGFLEFLNLFLMAQDRLFWISFCDLNQLSSICPVKDFLPLVAFRQCMMHLEQGRTFHKQASGNSWQYDPQSLKESQSRSGVAVVYTIDSVVTVI